MIDRVKDLKYKEFFRGLGRKFRFSDFSAVWSCNEIHFFIKCIEVLIVKWVNKN